MPIRCVEIANFKSFPVEGVRIPSGEGTFAGINLFVGPNGAGKTTLLAAIEIALGYDPQTSQGHFAHDGKFARAPLVFRASEVPLRIAAELEWEAGRTEWFAYSATKTPAAQKRDPRVESGATTLGHLLHPRNRVFPVGSRVFVKGYENAQAHAGLCATNGVLVRTAWPAIRDAAKRFFDLQLRPEEWSDLSTTLDARGFPALENSDGHASLLYLMMEIEKFGWETTFTIEEPENHLHPGLQRSLVEYLHHLTIREAGPRHQFLVTTHSPAFMSAVLDLPRSDRKVFRLPASAAAGSADYRVDEIGASKDAWAALRSLGHLASDVLQPNGIIWVEGPSDVIYIKTWLEAYAREPGRTAIRWGLDAEVVWYGGALLAHCGVSPDIWSSPKACRHILELLALNPNAAILMDRDNYDQESSTAKKRARKDRIIRDIESADPRGRTRIARLTPAGAKEIEWCLPRRRWPRNLAAWSRDKVGFADRYQRWAQRGSRTLREIVRTDLGENGVETLVRDLYGLVQHWRVP